MVVLHARLGAVEHRRLELLRQAMREELVFRNVAALVRVPMPRRQKQPVWTVEEARRFLESARVDDDPLYAA